MSDFNRVLTWYRTVLVTNNSEEQYRIWRSIHQVTNAMIPELLMVADAATEYANDPTSIERLHNLRQAIRRAQEDTR